MPDDETQRFMREGLAKGCLGGIGLTLLFMLVSAATYFILASSDLNFMVVLVLSILSGPIVGTGGVLFFVLRHPISKAKSVISRDVDSTNAT